MTNRGELPEIPGAAAICGSGESVTGPLCAAVAVTLYLAAQIWEATNH